jgi:hypothetical protein
VVVACASRGSHLLRGRSLLQRVPGAMCRQRLRRDRCSFVGRAHDRLRRHGRTHQQLAGQQGGQQSARP